nr:MAG TPA: Protein of unknown function (DUF2974) [Caudoviricetes sp.]
MAGINTYIKEYGDKTFNEEKFNEIDNVILSSVVYLNFDGIVPKNKKSISLCEAGNIFLYKYNYFDVSKLGIAQKVSYKILKQIVNTKRYKDIQMYNYKYIWDTDTQFGAVCFKVKKKFIYIAFEGTDNLLSGWKEDFQMAYEFPVPSQKLAVKYLNENIKLFDKNIIVGGHSKGGNLALVSSMYCKNRINKKIKQIYSNDGPGLKKEQIESENYSKIRDRLIHLVPNYSYVGVLLRNDKFTVIKTNRKDFMAHAVSSWQVNENEFIRENLSSISDSFRNSLLKWLDEHDLNQREKMISTVFKTLEESGIKNLNDFFNLKNAITVIRNINNIDDETKKLVISLIEFNLNNIIDGK